MRHERVVVLRSQMAMVIAILSGLPVLFLGGMAYGDSPLLVNQARLIATDPVELAELGESVAISGDTVVGGAPFSGAGSAYVFVKSGGGWSQQQKLTASDIASPSGFGWSVAVSGDTIVVGSPFERGDIGPVLGAVYVFVRSGTSWSLQQRLTPTPNDTGFTSQFGYAVAISGDTIVVGHLGDFDGVFSAGTASVFVRNGTSWSLQQKLIPSDPSGSFFGFSVALDGETALVGDASHDAGSAYVFVRAGSIWTEQQKLTATDATAGVNFGYAVALNGETIVVSDPFDDAADAHSGSAYVFVRNGASWSHQQKLTAADPVQPGDFFGKQFGGTVALSGDTIMAGARYDSMGQGAAYLFGRSGTSWSQRQKLTTSDPTASAFGLSVALSGDRAAIGSGYGGPDYGAVYIFGPVPINHPPLADAGPDRSVECTSPSGAPVELDGRRSSDPDGDPLSFLWTGPFGQIGGASPTVQFPLGSSNVTLTVADGHGGTASNSAQIIVQDTTAPTISALTAEPNRLWPPNHKMVPVTLAITVTDSCDLASNCAINSVTSNEPIAGDFSITAPLRLELRAERLGSSPGRTYSIMVGCRDASGNLSTTTVDVLVPHDKASP